MSLRGVTSGRGRRQRSSGRNLGGRLPGEALAEADGRLVLEVAPSVADVGTRMAGVARDGRQMADADAVTEHLLEDLEDPGDGRLGAAGDVVDGTRLAPRRRRNRGTDRIVDVGEVAALCAVAEDLDLTVVRGRVDEAVERHVRALARAVDGE